MIVKKLPNKHNQNRDFGPKSVSPIFIKTQEGLKSNGPSHFSPFPMKIKAFGFTSEDLISKDTDTSNLNVSKLSQIYELNSTHQKYLRKGLYSLIKGSKPATSIPSILENDISTSYNQANESAKPYFHSHLKKTLPPNFQYDFPEGTKPFTTPSQSITNKQQLLDSSKKPVYTSSLTSTIRKNYHTNSNKKSNESSISPVGELSKSRNLGNLMNGHNFKMFQSSDFKTGVPELNDEISRNIHTGISEGGKSLMGRNIFSGSENKNNTTFGNHSFVANQNVPSKLSEVLTKGGSHPKNKSFGGSLNLQQTPVLIQSQPSNTILSNLLSDTKNKYTGDEGSRKELKEEKPNTLKTKTQADAEKSEFLDTSLNAVENSSENKTSSSFRVSINQHSRPKVVAFNQPAANARRSSFQMNSEQSQINFRDIEAINKMDIEMNTLDSYLKERKKKKKKKDNKKPNEKKDEERELFAFEKKKFLDSLKEEKASENQKYPHLLKKSTMISRNTISLVDEKKEVNILNKWIEQKMDEAESALKYSPPDYLEESQKIFKKVLKGILPILGKDNQEKSKLIAKVWNSNIKVVQETLEFFIKKYSKKQVKFLKELNSKDEEIYKIIGNQKIIENNLQVLEQELQTLNEKNRKLIKENETQNNELHRLEAKSNSRTDISNTPHDLEHFSAKVFHDMKTDTRGLIEKQDRRTMTSFWEFQQSVQTQYDINDILNNQNEIPLSPAMPIKKRQTTDNFKLKIRKLASYVDESQPTRDGPAPTKEVPKEYNKYTEGKTFWDMQPSSQFSTVDSKSVEMMKSIEGMVTLEKLVKSFNMELDEVYLKVWNEVNEIPNDGNNNLKKILEQYKELVWDFVKAVNMRDSDIQSQLINFKINIIEKELSIRDKDLIIRNWKTRFDQFFNKHKKLQELWLAEEKAKKLQTPQDQGKTGQNSMSNEPAAFGKISSNYFKKKSVVFKPNTNEVESDQIMLKGNFAVSNHGNFIEKKKYIRGLESVNGFVSMKFITELKKIDIEPKDVLQIDVVTKILSAVYSELVKINTRRENLNPLYFFVYDYLLNRYGNLRQKTEEKLIEMLRTCFFFKQFPRCRMFLRLMTMLTEPYEYDGEELNFYIKTLIELDSENKQFPGLGLSTLTGPKVFIDLKKANDFIKNFVSKSEDSLVSSDIDVDKLLNIIKENKERDPEVPARLLVDADLVIESVLDLKHQMLIATYKMIFQVVDVNNETNICFEQYWVLVNNIEREKFNFRLALKLFNREYDLVDEETSDNNSKFLSFPYFARLCDKNGLFSKSSVAKFAYEDIKFGYSAITELEENWFLQKHLLKLKFLRSGFYNSFFEKMIQSIEDYFFNYERKEDANNEIVWIRYRILEEESHKRLLDFEVDKYIPEIMNDIYKKSNYILT